MYRLAIAHLNTYQYAEKQTTCITLPYNDVAPEDYCFYNVVSETASEADLLLHIERLGFTENETDLGDVELSRDYHASIAMFVPINETTEHCCREQKQALVWVKIPSVYGDVPVQQTIAPFTEEQFEALRNTNDVECLGVSSYGDDTDGDAAVIIEGWYFYHIAPLLGYTWQSVLTHIGVAGDEPTPFGFDDDSFQCGNCGVIDNMDDGYTYNQRETPRGDYVGVNCGCYDSACEDEYADNANNADKSINLDLARKLAAEGKLQFIARYIGGMVDPGRGGSFYIDEDASVCEKAAVNYDADTLLNRMYVENGEPEKILEQLRDTDRDGDYIFAHDESGQFQTYFSVWKIVEGQ